MSESDGGPEQAGCGDNGINRVSRQTVMNGYHADTTNVISVSVPRCTTNVGYECFCFKVFEFLEENDSNLFIFDDLAMNLMLKG